MNEQATEAVIESDAVLTPVVPDAIWVSERPIWFGGVRLRSRTTVVRLEDGRVLVHSPAEPTVQMREALDALGPVACLVIPNRFHHLQAPANAAHYVDAALVGPPSVTDRNENVRLTMQLDDDAFRNAVPELSFVELAGVPFLEETVLFHRPTGSLIGADIVISACARDHWSWRLVGRALGRYGRLELPPDVRLFTRKNDAARRAVESMLSLPIERILVAHADTIEHQPKEQLARAWRFVGVGASL